MTDAAAAVEAARQALEQAQAALAAAEQAAAQAAGAAQTAAAEHAEAAASVPTEREDASADAAAHPAEAPLTAEQVARIRAGYEFTGPALELGALVNGEAVPEVQLRIPLAMTNRHGLIAGATGTGKTRTLQLLAEQFSANGVPVFAADVKGDLSGLATPGEASTGLLSRTRSIGQEWSPQAAPAEFFSLGGLGQGVPIRATVSSFGPLLLSRVLGLNATQESSLGLVFHYADREGLPLLDLADLRGVVAYLVSDAGRAELKSLGGLSTATAGVILREIIALGDRGAERFFGEPEFDTGELLRLTPDGRGIVSLLQLPAVFDQPALFSTFLMWLLADLFNDLPEVGDLDRPKLVFFFDEAHLLFRGASTAFLDAIVQTVRLIRSKGVAVFFVTQTPKDVPGDVLAQLGSRVQHQLRAHTPDDAKALRATVSTYPHSGYELDRVLTELATGEAIVTVMGDKGAPTPVAWTRLRAPQGSMTTADAVWLEAAVAASPLQQRYGTPIDRESAHEILAARMNAAAEADAAAAAKEEAERRAAEAAKAQAKAQQEYERAQREWERAQRRTSDRTATTRRTTSTRRQKSPVEEVLGSSLGNTVVREVLRGVFGTLKRR